MSDRRKKSGTQLEREIAEALMRSPTDRLELALRALNDAERVFERAAARKMRHFHDAGAQRAWNKAYDDLEQRKAEYAAAAATWRAWTSHA
jgi:hypothetical protein